MGLVDASALIRPGTGKGQVLSLLGRLEKTTTGGGTGERPDDLVEIMVYKREGRKLTVLVRRDGLVALVVLD